MLSNDRSHIYLNYEDVNISIFLDSDFYYMDIKLIVLIDIL